MARYFTSNTLIKDVKRRGMLPASTSATFTDEDFLAFANEEMDVGIIPYVSSFHEDYFITSEKIPLVSTTTRYEIPHRAMGNKLREVRYVDTAGNIYEMSMVAIEDEGYFQFSSYLGNLSKFTVVGNEIVLPLGNSSVAGYLEMMYLARPNTIVTEDRVARVTNITGNVITIDNFPSCFAGITKFDITSILNPHKLVAVEIVPIVLASPSSLTMTFTSLPSNIRVGDIVAIPEETIIPQVMEEMHSMLSQRVIIRCLEALGDTQGLTNAMAKLTEMEAKMSSIIDCRVEGASKKVNNLHSHLRNARRWYRR